MAFLDRDGTLIQDQGNECNPKKISFNKEIIEVMKFLQCENFKTILITNQPGIAKGFFNQEKLDIFHAELQNGLINLGLKPLDDIYFCPHHPDKGYKNLIKKLYIKCKCRKTGTGMVKNAIHDHNLIFSIFIYI